MTVNANYFDVLGVKPTLGRAFLPGEDVAGHERVVVLSDELWRRNFGANSGIVDQTVALNGQKYTVVGVMPRELSALQLMAEGKANKEIGTALGISERTVKTHLGHLFEKLGVTSRTEAVRVATRRGLVRFD